MRPLLVLAVALVAVSCRYPNADEHFGLVRDEDGDGFNSDVDCDDGDANVNPDATEVCNGIDDDCVDGVDVDATDPSTFWVDVDGDEYGDDEQPTVQGCAAPEGYAEQGGDCNDDDKDFHPTAQEVPDDDLDQDCNGHDTIACYKDEDKDGFGNDDLVTVFAEDGACDTAQGESGTHDDCLDTNATAHPGGTETPGDGIDQDCSGADAPPCWADDDGDGFGDPLQPLIVESCDADGQVENDDDCHDGYATVNPSPGTEACDGFPSDCDDWDNATTPGAPPANEIDDDNDGFVECTFASGITAGNWGNTETPAVTGGGDCADAYATVNPNPGTEACDGFPSDCDAWTNFTTPGTRPATEVDDDNDGFVECTFASGITAGNWGNAESPAVTAGGDCNDTVGTGNNDGGATIFPGAPEVCDGRVNACGGSLPADEVDNDDDTYVECAFASGVTAGNWANNETPDVTDDGDCDDTKIQVFPGAVELCDGADNNCSGGFTDEAGKVSFQPTSGAWTDETAALKPDSGRGAYTAAASGTLWFCAGTYNPTILIPNTLSSFTVEGRSGAGVTFLSGADPGQVTPQDRLISATGTGSPTLTVRGLTLEFGTGTGNGGAIQFQGTPTATIEDCSIEASTASNGGGVSLNGGTLQVLATTFTGNTAGGDGGNIYINNGTFTFDADSVVDTGNSQRGGGIFIKAGTANIHGTIDNNNAKTNGGEESGGGIYLLAGTYNLDGAVVTANDADASGGGIFMAAGTLTATGLDITSNTAVKGGGLYATAGTVTITDLLVDDNTASGDRGGGGLAVANATLSVTDCDITRNDATGNGGDGGALLMDDNTAGASATFTTCTIGGSLVSRNTANDEGGALACRDLCTLTIVDTILSFNGGARSGGVDLDTDGSTFTCTATSPNAGAVTNNGAVEDPADNANAGGAVMGGSSATTKIISGGCDWGTGATDNFVDAVVGDGTPPTPIDIGGPYHKDAYGSNATFTCLASTSTCLSTATP